MPGQPVGCAPAPGGIDMLAEEACLGTAANLAMEEALVRAGPQRPVLRLWRSSASVVVGRGQRVQREVNLPACARDRVPVLRRASGGGTVYHDLGNLNISMAVPGCQPELGSELTRLVAAAIVRLGLAPLEFERGVRIGPAKVSGVAVQATRTGSLAHATFLVTTLPSRVRRYLAPAPPDRQPLDSRRTEVRPLRDYLPALDIAAARTAVLAAATARFGPLLLRQPHPAERRWFERLLAERYQDPAWHLTGRTGAVTPGPPGRRALAPSG
jgi:lipoate-protein ligase A